MAQEQSRGGQVDWVARVVSVVALLISALQLWQGYLTREAQFSAAVSFDIDTQITKNRLGIGLRNAGPGVAHIKAVEYYFDGRPVRDIDETLSKSGFDQDRDVGIELDGGDSLAPNEAISLIDYPSKNKHDMETVEDLLENRTQVAVTYCTENGKCVRKCSEPTGCSQPSPSTRQ